MSSDMLSLSKLPQVKDRSLPTNVDWATHAVETKPVVTRFSQAAVDLARRMWEAHQCLAQPGARRDLKDTYTFTDWCRDAGIKIRTAKRWVAAYDPLSDTLPERLTPKPGATKAPGKQLQDDSDGQPGATEPGAITTDHRQENGPGATEPGAISGATSNNTSRSVSDTGVGSDRKTVASGSNGVTSNSNGVASNGVSSNQSLETGYRIPDTRYQDTRDTLLLLQMLLSQLDVGDDVDTEAKAEQCISLLKKLKRRSATLVTQVRKKFGQTRDSADRELFQRIADSFQAFHHRKLDYAKESRAIWDLVDVAKQEDSPEDWAKQILSKFNELRSNGNDYWRGQPMLPTALASHGILTRVEAQLSQTDTKSQFDYIDKVLP